MTRRNMQVGSLTHFKDANKYTKDLAHQRLYAVFSYRDTWPLFIYDRKTGGWYGNESKFSVTTSKHTTQCYPYGAPITWMPVQDMLSFIQAVEQQEALTDVPH